MLLLPKAEIMMEMADNGVVFIFITYTLFKKKNCDIMVRRRKNLVTHSFAS